MINLAVDRTSDWLAVQCGLTPRTSYHHHYACWVLGAVWRWWLGGRAGPPFACATRRGAPRSTDGGRRGGRSTRPRAVRAGARGIARPGLGGASFLFGGNSGREAAKRHHSEPVEVRQVRHDDAVTPRSETTRRTPTWRLEQVGHARDGVLGGTVCAPKARLAAPAASARTSRDQALFDLVPGGASRRKRMRCWQPKGSLGPLFFENSHLSGVRSKPSTGCSVPYKKISLHHSKKKKKSSFSMWDCRCSPQADGRPRGDSV